MEGPEEVNMHVNYSFFCHFHPFQNPPNPLWPIFPFLSFQVTPHAHILPPFMPSTDPHTHTNYYGTPLDTDYLPFLVINIRANQVSFDRMVKNVIFQTQD